jgi:tetratricopeptide (TPR) repeat protein
VAVESRNFLRTIELLEANKDDLDPKALVDFALALEGTGRQEEAIALLEKQAGDNTDAMGVLAGRLKRRWLAGRRRSDAERALALYRSAYESSNQKGNHAQAYYQAVNVAFMELAYGSDQEAATKMAQAALDHCAKAQRGFWQLATEADARLILGDIRTALAKYREAVALNPEPRELKSMYQQAVRLADLLNDEDAEKELAVLWGGTEQAAAV